MDTFICWSLVCQPIPRQADGTKQFIPLCLITHVQKCIVCILVLRVT